MSHYQVQQLIGILKNHKDIPIEERNSEELSHIEGLDEKGDIKKIQIYPKKVKL